MTASPKRRRWIDLKARLQAFDRAGLVGLIADLYEASPSNRRYLDSRLFPQSGTIEEYRRMVVAAIAEKCSVHKTLTSKMEVVTRLVEYPPEP